MSLLLNALKKVEEGDKSKQDAAAQQQPAAAEGAAQAAAAPPAAGQAAPPATPAAPPPPAAAKPAISGTPAPGSTAKPAAAVDFDAIPDESAAAKKGPAIAGQPAPKAGDAGAAGRARVDAARVFAASEEGAAQESGPSSGALKKIIGAVVGLAVVGGGAYAVIVSGLIDITALPFGDQREAVVPTAAADVGAAEQLSEDVVLLPIPIVDVQAEVDFAALRLPENRPEIIGDDEYKKKIAVFTGYDIEQERQRIIEESGVLDIEEEEVEPLIPDADALLEEETGEDIVRTADASRSEKVRVDAITSSDNSMDIVIHSGGVVALADTGAAEAGDAVDEAPAIGGGNTRAAEGEFRVAQTSQNTESQVGVSAEGTKRNALIQQARRLYHSGAHVEAEAIYRNVLRASPTNHDALRGLAQVAVATGRYQLAAATYLDILNYYPNDPVAIAELTNLRGIGEGDFYETEKILKKSLGKVPSVDGRLYFALGNLYAGFNKWYDAQKAYFEAYSRETDNPDYAYNLAVVLDYLNKPALSARYYQEALDLSEGVLVGFNKAEVQRRINDLN